jgi:hypothetical protein
MKRNLCLMAILLSAIQFNAVFAQGSAAQQNYAQSPQPQSNGYYQGYYPQYSTGNNDNKNNNKAEAKLHPYRYYQSDYDFTWARRSVNRAVQESNSQSQICPNCGRNHGNGEF